MSTMESPMATMSPLQQFMTAFEQETATTLKLLKAYPESASELKPTPVLKNARELASIFSLEMGLLSAALRDQLDITGQMPPAPAKWSEVVAAFESGVSALREQLAKTTEEDLMGTVRFPTGPKQMGDIPKMQFAWFVLCDQIHHRGQFSVYMRMAGAKVPSIYGPTADEPWM